MKKLLIPLSLLLFSCEKSDVLPIQPPLINSVKPKEFRYDTLTSNEVRLTSTRWDNFNGKGLIGYADLNNDGEDDCVNYIQLYRLIQDPPGTWQIFYKGNVTSSESNRWMPYIAQNVSDRICPWNVNRESLRLDDPLQTLK